MLWSYIAICAPFIQRNANKSSCRLQLVLISSRYLSVRMSSYWLICFFTWVNLVFFEVSCQLWYMTLETAYRQNPNAKGLCQKSLPRMLGMPLHMLETVLWLSCLFFCIAILYVDNNEQLRHQLFDVFLLGKFLRLFSFYKFQFPKSFRKLSTEIKV